MMDPLPGEPETPKVTRPRRIVVSGSDLVPHLYQATERHPKRDLAVLIGKALFIVILVWLVGVAFLSYGPHVR